MVAGLAAALVAGPASPARAAAAPGVWGWGSSGHVWSWGDNTYGELGNGTTSSVRGSNPTPVPVPGLTGVTQVAAAAAYRLALKSDGTVWAWGDNDKGPARRRHHDQPGPAGEDR